MHRHRTAGRLTPCPTLTIPTIHQGAGQGLIDRLVENVVWAAAQDNDTWTSKRSLYASFRGEIINVRTGRVIKQIRRKEFGGILVTLNNNGSVKFVKTV